MSQIFLILLLTINNPNIKYLNRPYEDSVLKTGWYLISDTPTAITRILDKSSSSYFLEPTPIVSQQNIRSNTIFHEKDCYALISQLDSEGAMQMEYAKKQLHGKRLGLIVNDKLLRIQYIDDPQFCRVGPDQDPRVYGEMLTFPCNSKKQAELMQVKSMMEAGGGQRNR